MERIDKIALIAGSGKFPLFLAKAARANGVQVIAIAVNSESDTEIEKAADQVYWVNLSDAGRLIDILKKEEIQYAIMAGKITKATLLKESLRFDKEAMGLLKRVVDNKDNTLLSAVAAYLKDFGIELIDSTTFVKGMMPAKGVLSRRRPSPEELENINFGYKIAKEIGRLDIGQSVIVKKKAVIAVEAIEGTDEAIKRAGRIAGDKTVVVKVSRPDQDMRFDVPVVGLTTIESLKEAMASVLAIEAEKVLVLERDEMIEEADRAGICVVAV